jgi:hypothetical protein
MILTASAAGRVSIAQLIEWTDCKKKVKYLRKLIRQMHSARLLEFYDAADEVELLPPGAKQVQDLISKYV